MGELFDQVVSEQSLLDAWHEVRRRAKQDGKLGAEHLAFELEAASSIAALSHRLVDGLWEPSPVRKVVIRKSSGGSRRLGLSVLDDRIVEQAMLDELDRLIDRELLPWSYAYRRGLGVADARRALLEARDEGLVWVTRGDFRDCFDTIPRARLLRRLDEVVPDDRLLDAVRRLIERPVDGDPDVTEGIHQGSPLSPMLANLYLDRFDRAMLESDLVVIRYGDDFAIPVATRDHALEALDEATHTARAFGMDLGYDKKGVASFQTGVPFLGETLTTGTKSETRRKDRPKSGTVFVNEVGGLLRSRGDRLRLERSGEAVFTVSFARVRQVVLFGRIGVTTPFLHQVLGRNIDVVFLNEHGRFIGRLHGSTGGDSSIRRDQYSMAGSNAPKLTLARILVEGKIRNLRTGLRRGARRRPSPRIASALDGIDQAYRKLARARIVAELMGLEGIATRHYFDGFGDLFNEPWTFPGRQRRPPPDPVNSLLSFGYTLLVQEAYGAVQAAGLDPYEGVLHAPRVNRPSLALDLVEEFRPVVVDSLVLRLLNTNMLSIDDFHINDGPPRTCMLTRAGRRTFLAEYERRLLTLFTHPQAKRRVSYRVGMTLQGIELREHFAGKRRYEPIVWK